MKNIRIKQTVLSFILCLCLLMLMVCAFTQKAYASGDLDEILNYEITVDVNEDATLHMIYQIDWKVLDSDSEGPLSWVNIGIPNSHCVSYQGLSDTVKSVSYSSSGGSNLRITLDRNYYKDEVASFSFELVQDYMYEMNRLSDGETVFEFTPGWFNDIRVDNLTIRWNSDRATSWSPSCQTKDGYLEWQTSLGKGDSYPVQIIYPNDAFLFDESKTLQEGNSGYSNDYYYEEENSAGTILGGIILFIIFFLIATRSDREYSKSANFGTTDGKKITRTKIEYYPVCQGCGAPRPEGKDNCQYCGRSFIKSQEVIEEKDIPKEEQELRKKNTNGTYRYAHSPNTYIRVNVIPVPGRYYGSSRPRGGSSGGRSSRGGGGCACACASSCACACACACAGGGRAGCSTKDFYHTNVKLRYFE